MPGGGQRWERVTAPETFLCSIPTGEQVPAIRACPRHESALTDGGWKVHRGRSLGDERAETQKQGLQGQASGKTRSLLWRPTRSSARTILGSWSQSPVAPPGRPGLKRQHQEGRPPTKAEMPLFWPVFHSRKRAKLPRLWEPDKDTVMLIRKAVDQWASLGLGTTVQAHG